MIHATSQALSRLATSIRDYRLARDQQIAAAHGWHVQRITASTYRYRDPRFDQLATCHPARPLTRAGDRDG
jgi:hypothetical protein